MVPDTNEILVPGDREAGASPASSRSTSRGRGIGAGRLVAEKGSSGTEGQATGMKQRSEGGQKHGKGQALKPWGRIW